MVAEAMGRKGDTASEQEAADILGVHTRTLQDYVKKGWVRAHYPENWRPGDPRTYAKEEVCALKEILNEDFDLAMIYNTVVHTYVAGRVNDRRLDALERMLGLDSPVVEYDRGSIHALYLKARYASANPPKEPEELLEWAGIFMAIHPEYFLLAKHHLEDPSPWKTFLELGEKVGMNQPGDESSRDMKLAYGYFQSARHHLRSSVVAFLALHGRSEEISKEFPEYEPSPHLRLLNHLPHP